MKSFRILKQKQEPKMPLFLTNPDNSVLGIIIKDALNVDYICCTLVADTSSSFAEKNGETIIRFTSIDDAITWFKDRRICVLEEGTKIEMF